MAASPIDPHSASPAELQDRIRADGVGGPYLLFRDGEGEQRIIALQSDRMTVGRAPGCELALTWDGKVSGTHAQLELIGGSDWTVTDDGLSRNGSYVNGERVRQRRRLDDGDVLLFGDTSILFRSPPDEVEETIPAVRESKIVELSPAQRRVLIALCRPFRDDDGLRYARLEPADRRRARAERRGGQDAPAGPVREVRRGGPAQAGETRRAGQEGLPARRDIAAGLGLLGASREPLALDVDLRDDLVEPARELPRAVP